MNKLKIILEDFEAVCSNKKFAMSNLVDFLLNYLDDQKEIVRLHSGYSGRCHIDLDELSIHGTGN